MRVLVAPQEFKGSLGPDEAAAAIARGLRGAQPGWQIDQLPLSDGGPGFLYCFRTAMRADIRATVTHDALGRRLLGRYGWIGAGETGVVEAAQANGLWLVRERECDALRADSFGVGELILAALDDAPRRLLVGVGGSATTDGGAGMAKALGARLLDAQGAPIAAGGAALLQLERVEWERPRWAEGLAVVAATDVTNPLTGPEGAAAVYGPQKGASAEEVALLESALERYARVLERDLGVELRQYPGAGAAGGLAAGLVAFLGARVVSGFDVVAEATGLRERLAAADVVVTGEGSFDAQSLRGKTTGRLLAMAAEQGKPAVVLAGRAEETQAHVRTLAEVEADASRQMAQAAELLARLAARWASSWATG